MTVKGEVQGSRERNSPERLPSSVRRFSLRRSMGDATGRWSRNGRLAPDKGPVVALAGIARPERFFGGLRDRGWQVAREISFRDHHAYTAEESRSSPRRSPPPARTGVLTTEKDAERLLPWRPFPVRVGAVPLAVTIEPHEVDARSFRPPAAFRSWLLDRIPRRGREAGDAPAPRRVRAGRHRARHRPHAAGRVLAQLSATVIGLSFYAIDGAHRRLAITQLRAAFPPRTGRVPRDRARDVLRTSAACWSRCCRFSTLTRRSDARARRVRGRRSRARGAGGRQGRHLRSPGTSDIWELHGMAHRAGAAADVRAGPAARQSAAARAARDVRACHGQSGRSTGRARSGGCCARSRPNECVGHPDRSAHPGRRRREGGLLQPAGCRRRRRWRRWRCERARRSCRRSRCRSPAAGTA